MFLHKKTILYSFSKKLIPAILLAVFFLSPISISLEKTNQIFSDKQNIALTKNIAFASSLSKSSIVPAYFESPFNCSVTSPSPTACAGAFIYNVFFVTASKFMMAGGVLLDFMMAFSISPDVYNTKFVTEGWELARDLVNMLFIFILLFIAIATILQLQNYNIKALLAKLIIAALLINFSLFIARVVVDAGNITASFFHEGVANSPSVYAEKMLNMNNPSFKMVIPKNFSEGLASQMQPQFLFNGPENLGSVEVEDLIIIYIAGTILAVLAAFVFFSVAFVFLSRVIALWLLMILAPFAFLAMVLPGKAGSYAKQWWSELFGKSFCIAVFMFFLWVLALFYQSNFVNNLVNSPREYANFEPIELVILITLQFGITLALLQFAKKQAVSMCGSIGGVSVNIGGHVAKAVGFASGGVVGTIGRKAVGGYFRHRLNDKVEYKGEKIARREMLAKKASAGDWKAQIRLASMRKAETGSFDVLDPFKKYGKKLEEALPGTKDYFGLNTGAFGERYGQGGYKALEEEKTKRLVEASKKYETDAEKEMYAEIMGKRGNIIRTLTQTTIRERGAAKKKITDPLKKKVEQKVKQEAEKARREELRKEYIVDYANITGKHMNKEDLLGKDRLKLMAEYNKVLNDKIANMKADIEGYKSAGNSTMVGRLTKQIGELQEKIKKTAELDKLEDKVARTEADSLKS